MSGNKIHLQQELGKRYLQAALSENLEMIFEHPEIEVDAALIAAYMLAFDPSLPIEDKWATNVVQATPEAKARGGHELRDILDGHFESMILLGKDEGRDVRRLRVELNAMLTFDLALPIHPCWIMLASGYYSVDEALNSSGE